jgi:hypothetical protein
MYKVSAKLELNGTPFKQWNSVSLKQTLNTLTSIDISLPNAGGLYTNLPFEDMPIKFYLGWDTDEPPLRFDGSMDDIDFNIQKSGASMGMSGRDFGKILFDQLSVDADFKPLGNPIVTGYILDYIRSLNRNLSTPLPELFERNLIDDNNSAFSYLFEYDKSIEALKKLCSYGNYNWQMLIDQNNNRQFSVRAPKELIDDNAFHAFIVGSKDNYTDIPSEADIHHVTSLSIKKDFSYKKNIFKVFGAEEIEAIYPINPPANPKHLLYTDEGITSSGDALAVAKRLYESKSAPKTLVDFGGVGVETLLVGDIIYVNDFKYGASTLPSHLFRVIEINDSISFGSGWNTTIKVADYVPTLFQIFDGTEGL